MENTEDNELAEIQRRKMKEMLQRVLGQNKTSERTPAQIIVLTDSNFSSEVAKHRLMVVDFWAPWCGPCRMVGPLIEELAAEYAGRVVFGKINVDENQTIPASFGVRGIPTLMVFSNGSAVDTIVGACPKSHIESRFKPYL